MAYGSWVSKTVTLYNGQNYKITGTWSYRQDPRENKTQIRTEKIKISSVKSGYTFKTTMAEVGFISTGASSSTLKNQVLNVASLGSDEINTVDSTGTVSHDSNGNFPSGRAIHWYLDPGITVIGYPSYTVTAWQHADISGIPKIDRSTPTAKIESTTQSYTKITINASTTYAGTLYARLGTSGSWTTIKSGIGQGGGNASHTFTGLTPNKSYTIQVYAHRTYNDTTSSTVSKTVRTKAVPAPNVPQITASSITKNSVKIKMASGGTVYDSTTKLDGKAGNLSLNIYNDAVFDGAEQYLHPTISQLRSGYTISGLSAGKKYAIRVYSTAPITATKDYSQVIFTTKSDSSKSDSSIYIKTVSGWKQGIPYIKTSSGWKQGI